MKYSATIGLECHVQLKTKTKLFSAVGNDATEAAPNTLVSHIDVGLPGALPVLNQGAIDLSARAAFALNTEPQKFSKFDRKHYFYPDSPKGYQITQYEQPIIAGGHVEIVVDGKTKKIEIERANLEEDAGKNTHPAGADYSLVDLNRAGTPLLEIVSKPQLSSAAEAKTFARELWLLMKYAGVTDGDLYHGHVRFDVNTSLSKEPGKLGTRSEVKNLNSFRSVEAAINYEIKRQTELLEKGEEVVQETRGWNEAKQKTIAQRGKEEAHDYRYMPEPDVPPIELPDDFIKQMKKDLPELPGKIREELTQLGIDSNVIENLLDNPKELDYVIKLVRSGGSETAAKNAAFWFAQLPDEIKNNLAENEKEKILQHIIELSQMRTQNKLSSTSAKEIFNLMLKTAESPEKIATDKNMLQVSDEGEIERIVAEVLKENVQAAEDVKKGETKAIGFLVGQVMAKSKGQANPELAQQIVKKQLGIS